MRAQAKLFFIILAGIIALLFWANQYADAKPQPLLELHVEEGKKIAINSAYKVIQIDTNYVGSAVVVKKGVLITAAHVAVGKEKVALVKGMTDDEIIADVIYVNEATDVAVLYADVQCPCPTLIEQYTPPGVKIFTAAYPGYLYRVYLSQGLTAGTIYKGKFGDTIISAPIFKGMSGGGVFHTTNGHTVLVGLISAVMTDPVTDLNIENMGSITSSIHIVNALRCSGDVFGECVE